MTIMTSVSKNCLLTLACLALLGGHARSEAQTVYTSEANFLVAVTGAARDNFATLALGVLTPQLRSAGSFGYTVDGRDENDQAVGLFGLASASGRWLSTNAANDSILFSGIGEAVRGIGGQFFTTSADGVPLPAVSLRVTLVDDQGTHVYTFNNPAQNDFFGLVSTSSISSLSVMAINTVEGADMGFATVSRLTMATPVPEPANYALFAIGLAAVCLAVRRRQVA